MAVSFHARSNSVPSLQHPQAAYVDEQLIRLRSSEVVSSSSSSSIYQRLSNLQDLYDSLDKMIRLSITNQALSQDQIEKLIDGSLMILDLCNVAKDALSQMKEGLKEIQSILRRKRGDLSAEVRKYFATRKSLKKSFQKVLKKLRVGQNKESTNKSLVVFGETEGVTISLFESLFSFMSGSKACGKWSLVSKLMSQNKATCEAEANEFTKVDSLFQSEKSLKMEDVQMLESCIQDLEDGIESLSKSMIKYRVSLLNIF
ncbi:Carrier protein [Hirschfeldia incana]|nr:Carrier protein [Hirschfeldia incana]